MSPLDGSQDLMCAAAADLKALIEDVENGRKIAADYSEQAARLKQLGADERSAHAQLLLRHVHGTPQHLAHNPHEASASYVKFKILSCQ